MGVKGSRMTSMELLSMDFVRKHKEVLEIYDDLMYQKHLVELMTAETLLCRRLGVSKESLMDYMVKE